MTAPRYDVLGIGNAIVDVIARAEDDFLVAQGMHKGTMALIDEARAQTIYAAMGPAVESSGGSAANTIVGVAGFGGSPVSLDPSSSIRSATRFLTGCSRVSENRSESSAAASERIFEKLSSVETYPSSSSEARRASRFVLVARAASRAARP